MGGGIGGEVVNRGVVLAYGGGGGGHDCMMFTAQCQKILCSLHFFTLLFTFLLELCNLSS